MHMAIVDFALKEGCFDLWTSPFNLPTNDLSLLFQLSNLEMFETPSYFFTVFDPSSDYHVRRVEKETL